MPDFAARSRAEDGRARLSFLSACAFSLAIPSNVVAATVLAVIGTGGLLLSLDGRTRDLRQAVSALRLTAALVAVALAAVLVPASLTGMPGGGGARVLPAVAILLALLELRWTRRHSAASALTIVAVGVIAGVWIVGAAKGVGIDVVLLHEQAAAALARGADPYGAAVTVPNGAPGAAPGALIVGYPYPPVVAAVYAVSTWLLGDPRWANLASWCLLICSSIALTRERQDAVSALPLLLVAALPGWALMLQSGWTEMLSAALLGLAAALWMQPLASGIALGAALGSKQYFLVLLPLLVWRRDVRWRTRSIAAVATAVIPLLAAFAWSPGDAWRSLVLFHAQTPLRPDSSNLVGLLVAVGVQWSPPLWLGLGVPLALATVLARRADDAAGFCGAAAATLATFFLLSRQAMPNYWYLVAVGAALGAWTIQRPTTQLR